MSAQALRALGRAIRLTREEHGVEIPALAAESGRHATYLRELEAGRIDPDLESLLVIPEALARLANDPRIRASTLILRAEALEREGARDAA